MSKGDDLYILCKYGVSSPRAECIERQARDKAEPRIRDIQSSPIGQVKPQRDERVSSQFIGQRFWIHTEIIA